MHIVCALNQINNTGPGASTAIIRQEMNGVLIITQVCISRWPGGWSDQCSSHRLSLAGGSDLFVHSGEFAPDEILPALLWSGSPLQLLIVSSVVTAGFFCPSPHHRMPDNGAAISSSLHPCQGQG